MRPLARVRAYAAHPDPRVAACNRIALLVASNQPFYPLYVRWLTGGNAWVACLTLLSTPLFLAVPWVARRNSVAGRALLPLAGIGNTLLATLAFGVASGVALFLLPCALIAALAFRRRGRPAAILLAGLGLAVFAALRWLDPAPLVRFGAQDYARLFSLNGYSVAMLSAVVAWTFHGTPGDRPAAGHAAP